ncbi:MAG: transposase [Bacteroidales bacterium]|nr:transposase [Bacteroidales bacterium]
MNKYWLVTTDHLEDRLWFREEEDFRVGMNFVAIQAHGGKVKVLAFILMSNHVHFVLKGRWEDVQAFINGFKHRYSIYLREKYGIKEFLRGNNVDLRPVSLDNEEMERTVAYVHMNSVAANICAHPSQYPWGTGSVFFNPSPQSGTPLGKFSKRARQRLFHSRDILLPADWELCADGYITPASYVDVKAVEACFRTAKRMNYFNGNSSKARKQLDAQDMPAFRDQIILSALPDLCRSLFGKNGFGELSGADRTEFVRQIRYRFSVGVHQIARVCGISYDDAAVLMESV